ncbi:MAG: hypothetical protein IPH60_04730 [Flavobacteriales bacterium]|nr:hypothetical protein [Flavobacteriales bacterium]
MERVNAIALDKVDVRGSPRMPACIEKLIGTYAIVEGPRISISDLEVAGDTLWATTVKGLYRTMKVGEQVQLLPVPFLQGRILTTLERDGQGNLWIGSKEHGLFRLNGNSLDSLNALRVEFQRHRAGVVGRV